MIAAWMVQNRFQLISAWFKTYQDYICTAVISSGWSSPSVNEVHHLPHGLKESSILQPKPMIIYHWSHLLQGRFWEDSNFTKLKPSNDTRTKGQSWLDLAYALHTTVLKTAEKCLEARPRKEGATNFNDGQYHSMRFGFKRSQAVWCKETGIVRLAWHSSHWDLLASGGSQA